MDFTVVPGSVRFKLHGVVFRHYFDEWFRFFLQNGHHVQILSMGG